MAGIGVGILNETDLRSVDDALDQSANHAEWRLGPAAWEAGR